MAKNKKRVDLLPRRGNIVVTYWDGKKAPRNVTIDDPYTPNISSTTIFPISIALLIIFACIVAAENVVDAVGLIMVLSIFWLPIMLFPIIIKATHKSPALQFTVENRGIAVSHEVLKKVEKQYHDDLIDTCDSITKEARSRISKTYTSKEVDLAGDIVRAAYEQMRLSTPGQSTAAEASRTTALTGTAKEVNSTVDIQRSLFTNPFIKNRQLSKELQQKGDLR